MTVEALLFDLDGTLVDSAPDLVAVLNRMLAEQGRPRMPYAIARNEASNGALGLIRLGFGGDLSPEETAALRARFVELYAADVCIATRLFIEIDDIVEAIGENWGIVTNKPHAMTMPLLERLGIRDLPRTVVSGDRLPQRKPHPAPLELAARELGVPAARCCYVGDSPRDIAAGKAAGMATIAATYGYIRPDEDVRAWGADALLERPDDLVRAVASLAGSCAP
ncbi:MAG TPA: HAD-IA family hydrolase [Gammaproteobacteria bacterium]